MTSSPPPIVRWARGRPACHEEEKGLFVEERVRAVILHEDALPFRRALRERLISGGGPGSGGGLQNVLVHMYDIIDYEIVATSIDRALEDFEAFLDHYRARLEEWDARA